VAITSAVLIPPCEYVLPHQVFCVFLFLIGASLFGTLLSRLNEILQVVPPQAVVLRTVDIHSPYSFPLKIPLARQANADGWAVCVQSLNKESHEIDAHLESYISFMADYGFLVNSFTIC
jgi:hypothetical protein